MRILLTGGGTAGHINPALAIAETVRQNDPTAVLAFVGTERGIESDLIPREGYPLYYVRSRGFYRPIYHPKNIGVAWTALYSPYAKQTVNILKEFRPDLVIGTGGYACWPIASAAIRMGIPCALHESNALPGLAIRRLHGKADRVWLHFEDTAKRLSEKDTVRCVGNPLRSAFGTVSKENARAQLGIPPTDFRILSYGGSIGAEKVNASILELMRDFSARHSGVSHLHATGKREIEHFRKQMREMRLEDASNCCAEDYIYDMPLQLAAADLVICRAGAMTISELACMKKAAILIPSPNVAENHQYLNAKVLADAGAAVLIEERELVEGTLSQTVDRLWRDRNGLSSLEHKIGAFGNTNANQMIWEDILKLVRKEK